MIKYQPKQKKAKSAAICLSLAICGFCIIIFAKSHIFSDYIGVNYMWAFQIIGILPILASIMLSDRFLFTDYVYVIDELLTEDSACPRFCIYLMQGSKRKYSYCLDFSNLISVSSSGNTKKLDSQTTNFCSNPFAKNVYCVKYMCDEKEAALYIECDETFASEILNRINQYGTTLKTSFKNL